MRGPVPAATAGFVQVGDRRSRVWTTAHYLREQRHLATNGLYYYAIQTGKIGHPYEQSELSSEKLMW